MTAACDADALHPGWLHALWPGLDGEQARLLLTIPRLQRRLSGLVAARFGWAEAGADGTPDALLAAAPRAQLDRAATLAGAAWHARAIRQVIAAPDVERLQAAIGAEARGFALANLALAAAVPERAALDRGQERGGMDGLPACIEDAGAQCRAAWLAGLAPGLRRLVLPKLPPALAMAAPSVDSGPALAIMARVVAHLAGAGAAAGAAGPGAPDADRNAGGTG